MMDLFTAAGQADLLTVQQLLQAGADVDQGRVEHSHWSRLQIPQDTVLSLVGIMVLLPQLSYAIQNQLKAPTAPYWRHFLLFAGSLWHKDRWLPRPRLLHSAGRHLDWLVSPPRCSRERRACSGVSPAAAPGQAGHSDRHRLHSATPGRIRG